MASRKHTHASCNAVPLNTVDDTYIKNEMWDQNIPFKNVITTLFIFCTSQDIFYD